MTEKDFERSLKLAGLKIDDKDGQKIREYLEEMLKLLEPLKNETINQETRRGELPFAFLRDDTVLESDGQSLLKHAEGAMEPFYTAPIAVKQDER